MFDSDSPLWPRPATTAMPDTAQTEDFSYRFLQDIARDLSQKDLKFPTFI